MLRMLLDFLGMEGLVHLVEDLRHQRWWFFPPDYITIVLRWFWSLVNTVFLIGKINGSLNAQLQYFLLVVRPLFDDTLFVEVSGLIIDVILSIVLLDLLKAAIYHFAPILQWFLHTHDSMPDHLQMIHLRRRHLPLTNCAQTNLDYRGLRTPLDQVDLHLARLGTQEGTGVDLGCIEFYRGFDVRVLAWVPIRIYRFLVVL